MISLFWPLPTLAAVSTVAVGVAWLVTIPLRRKSAALRQLLWLLALAAPLLALALDESHLRVAIPILPPSSAPASSTGYSTESPSVPQLSSFGPTDGSIPAAFASSHPAAGWPQSFALPINPWIAAWLIGAGFITLRIFSSHVRVGRLIRQECSPAPERLLRRLDATRLHFNFTRPVRLLITPLTEIPFCYGLLRPTVIFPESWRKWDDERIEVCLTHELAHLVRGDLLAMFVAHATRLLCWFNPLVWFAAARLRDEAENAADDLVLAKNIRPETYAANLVAITEKYYESALAPTIALFMARPNRLRSRVEAILDSTLHRKSPGLVARLSISLLAGCALTTVMAVRLTAAPAPASDEAKKVADFKALLHADPKDFHAVQVTWGQLEAAIKSGDIGTVEALLKAGFSPDGDHKGSWDSPIYTATCAHQVAIVDLLLAHGANPSQCAYPTDVYTSGAFLPIDAASLRGYQDIADRLLKAGATSDPIRYPAGMGDIAALQERDAKKPLTQPQVQDGLKYAAASGHLKAFDWLWTKVAPLDPKAKDSLISSFYDGAIQNDHLDVLQRLELLQSTPDESRALALWFALQWNQPAITSYLLDAGVSANAPLQGGLTPLLRAVITWKNDPIENVRLLLDHGADMNARDLQGNTALNSAIDQREDDVARLLVERGANLNETDSNGESAAWHAASIDRPPGLLDLLLTKGAHTAGVNKNGETLLSTFLRGEPPRLGNFDLSNKAYTEADVANFKAHERRLMERLIAAGCDVNGPEGSVTPLMMAIMASRYDAAQVLIDHGANLETKGHWGRTALAWFFSPYIIDRPFPPGAVDFLGSLLRQGANPNAESLDLINPKSTMSVLELALADPFATPADRSTYRTAVPMLLDHGALFPGTKNADDQALLQAAARGDVKKMEDAIAQGASVNASEAYGFTPLIISVRLGYDAPIQWLIRHAADLNVRTRSGPSALLMAVVSRREDLVDLFLAKGARLSENGNELDCAIQNSDQHAIDALLKAGARAGNYTLIECIQFQRTDLVKTLLDQGASPQPPAMDDMDKRGTVYWAVDKNQGEILKLLLDHGADPTWKISSGETALSLAQQSRKDLVPMLEESVKRLQGLK